MDSYNNQRRIVKLGDIFQNVFLSNGGLILAKNRSPKGAPGSVFGQALLDNFGPKLLRDLPLVGSWTFESSEDFFFVDNRPFYL